MLHKVKQTWIQVKTMPHSKPVMALSIMVIFMILAALVAYRGPTLAQSSDGVTSMVWRDFNGDKRTITYIELPKEAGRHDRIERDFFLPGNPAAALRRIHHSDGIGDIEIIAPRDQKNMLIDLCKTLRLQAVMMGDRPMVFINDALLSVGQTLTADENHVFEVMAIQENAVHLKWNTARIVLRLSGDSDGYEQ